MLGVAALVTIVILLAMCVLVVRMGIGARAKPGKIEAALARGMRNLAIPSRARETANPVPATREVHASARAHFADHCAGCHGNDGSGARRRWGGTCIPRLPT